MKKCKHCGEVLYPPAKKINGYCVCNNCYHEFVEKQHKIYENNLVVPKNEQWWNL
jgi:DNA-directed RNA polymerase subunit M/transcription elongation factor TFIIS